MAAAEFGLGEQLYKSGHPTEAVPHFKEAQRLNPKSWNYKRQAWALSDAKSDYGTSFREEVDKIGGSKVYYPPPELPKVQRATGKETVVSVPACSWIVAMRVACLHRFLFWFTSIGLRSFFCQRFILRVRRMTKMESCQFRQLQLRPSIPAIIIVGPEF